MAQSQEFIDALAATLFSPHDMAGTKDGLGGKEGEEEGGNMIEYHDEEVGWFNVNVYVFLIEWFHSIPFCPLSSM